MEINWRKVRLERFARVARRYAGYCRRIMMAYFLITMVPYGRYWPDDDDGYFKIVTVRKTCQSVGLHVFPNE